MVVGEMPEAIDLLVVGGGPGGYTAALEASHRGRHVTLVDVDGNEGLGGVCLNVGCIPSKALIELADRAHGVAHWSTRGLFATAPTIDMNAFQGWKSDLVHRLNAGVGTLLEHAGVEVIRGRFRFTRSDQGAVEHGASPPRHLRFHSCVIATGSRPRPLEALPRDGSRVLNSTDVLELQELPSHTTVVGAGYVGLELSTALSKLGVGVTLVEAADRILPAMASSLAGPIARRLEELGVEVITSAHVTGDDGEALSVECASSRRRIQTDCVVVATGRVPNTDDLGLASLGIEADRSGLLRPAPDRRVTPIVAAIGDVVPGPSLAHKATAEARVAVETLCGRPAVFDPAAVPEVVFSDPEVAVAGASPDEARVRGHEVAQATFPFTASGRASIIGEQLGSVTWTFDSASGVVLGAELIGPRVGDLVAEAALAIEMGAVLEDIAATIHPHPTLSESLAESAAAGIGFPIHVPRTRHRPEATGHDPVIAGRT